MFLYPKVGKRDDLRFKPNLVVVAGSLWWFWRGKAVLEWEGAASQGSWFTT